jgi:hypothetical protein
VIWDGPASYGTPQVLPRRSGLCQPDKSSMACSMLSPHPLEISPNVITNSGTSFSPAAKPLSKREVNKILKAHVKRVAREISAIVNGSKEIVLVNEEPLSEVFDVAAPPHYDNKPEAKMSGKSISGPTQILARPLNGISRQRLYRSVGASSSEGVQVLRVYSYSAGIRWPRRVRQLISR